MVRDSVLACALLLASCTEPARTTLGPVELTEVGPGSLLRWSNPETRIVARFSGDAHHDRHGIRLRLKQPRALDEETVVVARYRVDGWKRLDHVAFVLGPALLFVARHPNRAGVNEDRFRLAHRFVDAPNAVIPERLSTVELQVRGIPGEGAYFELESLTLEKAPRPEFVVDGEFVSARDLVERPLAPLPQPVSDALDNYLENFKRGRTATQRAEAYLREQKAVFVGLPALSFESPESLATQIHAATKTHRFRWHSWDLMTSLVQAHRQTGETAHRSAALSLAEAWLDAEYARPPSDATYVWYDHAVADRLIALHLVYRLAMEQSDREFAARLARAIHAHATLMASPWFYSHHQGAEFHNHAIFQDIALISSSDLLPMPESEDWRKLALTRLERQLTGLTSDEGISFENSFSYHLGLAKLCHLASSFARSARIEARCQRMDEVSRAFAYPDGRAPSFGDSARVTRVSQPESEPAYASGFPDAGYFIARGGKAGDPRWQVTMVASSKTETHAHADHLSLSYWRDGTEWLIDPGVYSYEDEPMARYARGPRAHNTPFSDARAYSLAPGRATLMAKTQDGTFQAAGVHRAQPGLVVHRTLEGRTDGDVLRVRDRVEGSLQNNESIALRFHLGERVRAELEDGRIMLSVFGGDGRAMIEHQGLIGCRLERGEDGEKPSGWAFPEFLSNTPIVVVACQLDGDTASWSIGPAALK